MEEDMADGLRTLLGTGERLGGPIKQAESMRTDYVAEDRSDSDQRVLPTGAGKEHIVHAAGSDAGDRDEHRGGAVSWQLMDDLVTRATAMGVDCIRYRTSMSAGREERAAGSTISSCTAPISFPVMSFSDTPTDCYAQDC
ncbi:hypothetical protein GCM10020331_091590 [Ectobacillus funiculus]